MHYLDWDLEYDSLAFYNGFYNISRAAPARVEGHKVKGAQTHLSVKELILFQQLDTSHVLSTGPGHDYLEDHTVP